MGLLQNMKMKTVKKIQNI